MSRERETPKTRDFLGNEKEEIFEDGRKVGEIKSEDRGGILGIGGEQMRVEHDNDGNERSHTKVESRGAFLGMGSEPVEVRYDRSGDEVGTSKVEERGGILGVGSHHVRVERDSDGNELSQSNHERRGDFLGMGGERVKVSRYSDRPEADAGEPARAEYQSTQGSSIQASSKSFFLPLVLIICLGAYLLSNYLRPSSPLNHLPADNFELPSQMLESEKTPFREWLRANSRFRPVDVAECMCGDDLPYIRKAYANHDPYYAAGDFNGDGRRDFAVVVVDRSISEAATPPQNFNSWVIVFNRTNSSNTFKAFLLQATGIPSSSLLFLSRETGQLAVGKWEGEVSPIVATPRGYSYQ